MKYLWKRRELRINAQNERKLREWNDGQGEGEGRGGGGGDTNLWRNKDEKQIDDNTGDDDDGDGDLIGDAISIAALRSYGDTWLRRFGDSAFRRACLRDIQMQIYDHLVQPNDTLGVLPRRHRRSSGGGSGGGRRNVGSSRRRFDTCAVVGSSYTLLGAGFGEAIDGHEQVFRFNWSPLEAAYADDVGSKTTFMFTNRAAVFCSRRTPPLVRKCRVCTIIKFFF